MPPLGEGSWVAHVKWKKHSPEDIVAKLARVRAAGVPRAEAVAEVGISEATYFRWRAQYGSLSVDQLRAFKRLELENARLRRALEEFEVSAVA